MAPILGDASGDVKHAAVDAGSLGCGVSWFTPGRSRGPEGARPFLGAAARRGAAGTPPANAGRVPPAPRTALLAGLLLAPLQASGHDSAPLAHDATRFARDAAPAALGLPDAPALAFGWQTALEARRPLTAVALDGPSGRVAAGDPRGVILVGADGEIAGSEPSPAVTALAFTDDGELLVGTREGLYLRRTGGGLAGQALAPGEGARGVRRLAACGGAAAVATDEGVFVSRGGSWQPVPGPLARTEAQAVALRCRGGEVEMWAVGAGDVWYTHFRVDEPALDRVEPAPALDPGIRARAVDVLLEPGGGEAVLAGDRLALRSAGSEPWRVVRPALAPGAEGLRLGSAAGRRWIASDRGLFAEEADGGWARLPAASAPGPVYDVTGDGGRVLAATDKGLLEGRTARSPGSREPLRRAAVLAAEFPMMRDPAVEEVFRAALDHLGLRPEALRDLRRGLALRGLLPKLDLRIERTREIGDERDDRETFTSGTVRQLSDLRSGSQRDVSALVELSWDLGEVAFPSDAVDLSKEARAVIQLRDDVLDEITHLFFERRRVLLELAGLEHGAEAPDADQLRLRADELAAGLDAWTGGWFGRRVPSLSR